MYSLLAQQSALREEQLQVRKASYAAAQVSVLSPLCRLPTTPPKTVTNASGTELMKTNLFFVPSQHNSQKRQVYSQKNAVGQAIKNKHRMRAMSNM